jgi:hypothetical protein
VNFIIPLCRLVLWPLFPTFVFGRLL